MKNGVVLGIDAGTSSVKTSLFTLEGTLIREMSFPVHVLSPAKDQFEIDVEFLFQKLITVIKEIVVDFEDQVQGIGLSVTSPTLIFFDSNRDAIRPGIVYLDNRSIKEVEEGVEKFGGDNMYFARVGNNPSPSTCVAATVNWIRNNEPGTWSKTDKIGFLNTYLGAKLTGNIAVDPTVSSYSGLMRVRNPYLWESEFLEIFDIHEAYLPEILSSADKVGVLQKGIADQIGLPAGIPVAIGAADTAATSFALGVHKHGDVFQSMGTSEVITFCLNTPNFSPAFMNRGHVIPGLWLSNGAMSTAGASIQWALKNIFPECCSEKELENLAQSSPRGANGLVFLPYLCGERSPVFDTRASGLFFGLNINTYKADIIRAVYEGVAYGMQQIYKIGSERWNVSPDYIKCVGGASKSALAIQLRADVLNKQVRTIQSSNTAAYGAAMLGALAAGVYTRIEDVPCIEDYGKIVEPNHDNVSFFEKHSEIYRQLYPNLKELMRMQYSYLNGDVL
ncbi:xylulokinase [Pelosinus propionicus]|uniref:Xylulokinase n=1 Tax=Pelosinus propionicus DSM 13327 TaxID=1123291 RepID=A0A1I4NXE2_9FIRM|nr:FGGY family carbohydrate kinase [Pelosinus propionicus]SFM20182.1 xylulokinase [Pelosinus propionicus DSM 13327]